MSTFRRSILLLCCWIATAPAQVRPRIVANIQHSSGVAASRDTLRLLAVMVRFPYELNPYTTGTGQFEMTPNPQANIDPPPHDGVYVRGKLQFVRNYFRTASHGRLTIVGTLLDSVITVSRPESAYAPPLVGTDLAKLARLAGETWHLVDSLYPSTVFAAYDGFVLFHAGAGRDVDLVSLVGQNPTPLDLPSIAFDSSTFASALGSGAFSGFPVNGGSYRIKNTIILPETESRNLAGATGPVLLELGINGLFAASVGNLLGLPDLFDTNTGATGIGTFGLMDPASIFAFAGTFPPLPSAWERMTLGWATVVTVDTNRSGISLDALGSSAASDTIIRVPVSGSEYFLLENRSRDVRHDGQLVRFVRPDGFADSVRFFSDTTGFNTSECSDFKGSVVDVEDYDWALPGYISKSDTVHHQEGGGILIWHIDENIIAANRSSNTVNADPSHRGVNLEEADGSRDIGQSYGQFDAGSGTEYGSPYDFWFSENVAPPFTGHFDGTSQPSSASSSGAASLVSMSAFSQRSEHMTFRAAFGSPQMTPIPGFPRSLPGLSAGPIPFDPDGSGTPVLFALRSVPSGRGELFAWKLDGTPYLATGNANGLVAQVDSPRTGALIAFTRNTSAGISYGAAVSDGVYLWRLADANVDGRFDLVRKFGDTRVGARAAMFVDTLLVIAARDSVTISTLAGTVIHQVAGHYWNGPGPTRLGSSSTVLVSSGDTLTWLDVSLGAVVRQVALGARITGISSGSIRRPDSTDIWVRTDIGGLCLNAGGSVLQSTLRAGSGESRMTFPLLADVDGDGQKEVLNADTSGRMTGFRWNGVPADGFPISLRSSGDIGVRSIVAMDLHGKGASDLLVADSRGDIEWWDVNGGRPSIRATAGLSTGAAQLSLFRYVNGSSAWIGLAAGDAAGNVRAYDLRIPFDAGHLAWPMDGYDAARSGSTRQSTASPSAPGTGILASGRVYNWPNPVYGSSTQFRFYVTEDATVTIRILDLAGRLVTTLTTSAMGGTDTELTWNVSGIQSGIYLARVEAEAHGRSAQMTVKVAVVK